MLDGYRSGLIALVGMALIGISARSPAASNDATPPAPQLSEDANAFLRLVVTYRGKAFCAPPGATIGDVAVVVKQYMARHPELQGRYTDQQALQALADAYPCTASPGSNIAGVPLDQMGARKLEVTATGEYATIDTKPTIAMVRRLRFDATGDNSDLVAQITKTPGNYMPPVLFALAEWYYKRNQIEEAIFWLNAAALRGEFDAAICTDVSAKSAIIELAQQLPPELYKQEFADKDRFNRIVDRAIRWDETAPATYDHRWISLHGLNATNSGLGMSTARGPLTVARDHWIAIAQQNRQQYRADMYKAADRASSQ
jgi:Rap1a immunity proteins